MEPKGSEWIPVTTSLHIPRLLMEGEITSIYGG